MAASQLKKIARLIRRDIVAMTVLAGSGHPGGSLSATDIKAGISCAMINLHTIKSIDRKALIASAKKTGAVGTAEEHQLARECPVSVESVEMVECETPLANPASPGNL